MTASGVAVVFAEHWYDIWHGNFDQWFMTSGLHILLLLIGGVLAARFVTWAARKATWRVGAGYNESDMLARSEAAKHRQAVTSVISWVAIAIISVVVALEITHILQFPIASLVAPATVLGAALGFGAQQVVKDLLSGFLIIAEKQYGFGDLVGLKTAWSSEDVYGTVEEITLRVTRLRSSEGEVYTVPNGQIIRSTNLSRDWARAVIDIPVPTSADLNVVNEVLHQECEKVRDDELLGKLLLDAPSVMGVESIQVDTVKLRMVARTLPGRQFEAGRKLRALVVQALARAGIVSAADGAATVGAIVHPATASGAEDKTQGPDR
jgi:moderate conductance mechanosensitive channel